MVKEQPLNPRFARLDASTICQLKCPSCPTATGRTGRELGVGYLKLEDFKDFIRRNPNVAHIELSNWGEVFLNKDLARILAHAHRHNVCLYFANGANLNHVREDVAEALVKYKLRRITCSIDGASQETYVQYRVKGDFNQVMDNVRMINRLKAKYRSPYPLLKWQFVAFGHNEHEIAKAREMAKSLGMSFFLKLSWADLYDLPDFSPVKNKELVGKETGLGVASRKEYMDKYGQDYVERSCCWDMWSAPQINYDGRMLGCPINYWGDYGNVFAKGLDACLNGEKMQYARDMLMGKKEARKGIPCSSCKVYRGVKKDQAWVTEKEIQPEYRPGRRYIMVENKFLGEKGAARLLAAVKGVRRFFWRLRNVFKGGRLDVRALSEAISLRGEVPGALPNQGYPLPLPLPFDEAKKWEPHFLFRGPTKGIQDFSCHASALVHGHCPHPPHTHPEEEILMMLKGEADLLLPMYLGNEGRGRLRLKPGEFVYYPPGYPHTLQTVSTEPANYIMLRWYTPNPQKDPGALPFGKYQAYDSLSRNEGKEGFHTGLVFEGPSRYLKRMQCHASVLSPGAGYEPHADPYDVLILILDGEVETLGKRFGPHSVIFHPAGRRHGILNPGQVTAQYVVFEFQRS
ncbi:MAG: cupin domain-containing protein [Candidatus Omnitrophota bacterium]|nr:cupin domain-containing protein [Candidatus Omnitrophota bacterium]MDZ4242254.1 cupin domain-containing protein [Candidatus Omnitrophota bacterium]